MSAPRFYILRCDGPAPDAVCPCQGECHILMGPSPQEVRKAGFKAGWGVNLLDHPRGLDQCPHCAPGVGLVDRPHE